MSHKNDLRGYGPPLSWIVTACLPICVFWAQVASSPFLSAQEVKSIPAVPERFHIPPESIVANGDVTEGGQSESENQDPKSATAPATPQDPLLFESGPNRVKFSLDAVFQQSGVTGSWWNLSEQFAPDAGYKLDRAWAETWIKPGIRVDTSATDWLTLYAGVSYVGSGNIGKDVFEQGNRGLWSVEDAYLGTRFRLPDEMSTLDLSYGRQPYKIGSGMLISVGAMNGFERGATTTFARRAWEEAGILKWSRGPLSLDGFYLNPNELRSASTNTRLAGTKFEWNPDANQSLGIAYFNVFESIYPYVAAPIQLIPDGRQGLNTLHVYGNWKPLIDSHPGWHIAGDYAHQWNDRIHMAAHAYNAETGYAFAELPLTPRLVYAFRSFSGDDPATTRFEKFDPLFYEPDLFTIPQKEREPSACFQRLNREQNEFPVIVERITRWVKPKDGCSSRHLTAR